MIGIRNCFLKMTSQTGNRHLEGVDCQSVRFCAVQIDSVKYGKHLVLLLRSQFRVYYLHVFNPEVSQIQLDAANVQADDFSNFSGLQA